MKIFFSLLLVMLCSCHWGQKDVKEFDFQTFKLYAPSNWQRISGGYFDGLTNLDDTIFVGLNVAILEFMISAYSDNDLVRHLYANDTIDGNPALYVKSTNPNMGIIGVDIQSVDKDKNQVGSIKVFARNPVNSENVLNIIKTISFNQPAAMMRHGHDHPLIFRPSDERSGVMFFLLKCSSCHSINKDLTGPAIGRILDTRTKKWIYTFLTERHKVPQDSIMLLNISRFKQKCHLFPEMSRYDFDMLYDYIR